MKKYLSLFLTLWLLMTLFTTCGEFAPETPAPEAPVPENSNPGDVWITPRETTVDPGAAFTSTLVINTGTQNLGGYGIKIFYNRNLFELDTLKTKQGVTACSGGFLTASNSQPGMLSVAGFTQEAKPASTNFELLTIYWKAVAHGSAYITITVETLADLTLNTIGTPNGLNSLVTVE